MSARPSLQRACRAVLVAALATALAGCGGAEPSSEGTSEPQDASTTAQAPADAPAADVPPPAAGNVTVISTGDEPRTQLRYAYEDGQTFAGTIHQTITISQNSAEGSGDVSYTAEFDISGEVRTDGDNYVVESTVEDPRVVETDAPAAAALEQALSVLDGLTTVATIDPYGNAIDTSLEMPDDFSGDPSVLAQTNNVIEQSQLSVPLPSEPVGVGARWTSVQEISSGGIQISQTTESELRSIDGSTIEVVSTTTQDPPTDLAGMANMPAGAKASVDAWDVRGEISSLTDLTEPIPEADGHVEGHQEMTIEVESQTIDLAQDISSDISITPR